MKYENKWALVNELNKTEESSSGDKMRIGQFAEKRKNYGGVFLGDVAICHAVQDSGCKIQDPGYRIQDTGCTMQDGCDSAECGV
jgi:hypothetical protein